jgi:hypothetical protein
MFGVHFSESVLFETGHVRSRVAMDTQRTRYALAVHEVGRSSYPIYRIQYERKDGMEMAFGGQTKYIFFNHPLPSS